MSTISGTGTISSVGIGSGLDSASIISQLVALEKQPLPLLATKATNEKAQISSFAQIQSQISSLTDAATAMADKTTWIGTKSSSSNTTAAAISSTASAQAGSFTLDVDRLATQQSVTFAPVAAGATVGSGTLKIQLGTWSTGGAAFTPAVAAPVAPALVGVAVPSVSVDIASTDTVAQIAVKINAANAGVVATTFNDGTSDRLILKSKDTGTDAGFQVTQSALASTPLVAPTLSAIVFDPSTVAPTADSVQYGQKALARINGYPVSSNSNTLASNVPGVTITLLATTTTNYDPLYPTGLNAGVPDGEVKSSATLTVSTDVTPGVSNVQKFVTAYNTLNATLTSVTNYDAATQTAGLFQGDSTIVGLQNVMRRMLGSTSLGASTQYLSDVGLELQKDGSLTINTAKLSTAANNGTTLQQLFTNNNSNAATNGFALKFRDFGKAALGIGGSVTNEAKGLQAVLDANTAQQTKVNSRATALQAQLQAQYSALDVQMQKLNSLNAYVTQQVTLWNKSTSGG